MMYQNFSKRQLLAMTWWNRPRLRDRDGILCDGAIRSGKTLSIPVTQTGIPVRLAMKPSDG